MTVFGLNLNLHPGKGPLIAAIHRRLSPGGSNRRGRHLKGRRRSTGKSAAVLGNFELQFLFG